MDGGESPVLRVGQRWPVESLIGQINGRPIFAEEVFSRVEAEVMLAAQNPNPEQARAGVDATVRRAFRQQVESELILAEAESRLSPEMKQGLLGWLRDLQETTRTRCATRCACRWRSSSSSARTPSSRATSSAGRSSPAWS
jgi:hypothetical protein